MKEIPTPIFLFAVSVFMILDLEGFNKVFDVVNAFYLLLLIPIFLLYKARRASYDAEHELKLYSLNKKRQGLQTWQDEFAGKWTKIDRTGFYEFMIFNGAPSFVASLKHNSDFSQIFEFDPNDNYRFQLRAMGVPTLTLPWIKIGRTEEEALLHEAKDPLGYPFQMKFWYEEQTKTLHSWGINESSIINQQTRKIDENGILHFFHSVTKLDGSSVAYSATLKHV